MSCPFCNERRVTGATYACGYSRSGDRTTPCRHMTVLVVSKPSATDLFMERIIRGDIGGFQALSDMSIDELNLSVRTTMFLEESGIKDTQQLIHHSAEQLLELRNFGETALAETRHKLAVEGLRLRGD